MLLAAGYGARMRPLTDHKPKPLLEVAGKPLLQYHLEALRDAGLTELVINLGHLGEQIRQFVGDGAEFGLSVRYSCEDPPLETAGGIVQALPLLCDGADDAEFLVVNGDIMADYRFGALAARPLTGGALAHLVMVDNPSHHSGGDFVLHANGAVGLAGPDSRALTYSGIARFHARLFRDVAPGVRRLRPLFEAAIVAGAVRGEHFSGQWTDVGTPQRLAELNQRAAGGDSAAALL